MAGGADWEGGSQRGEGRKEGRESAFDRKLQATVCPDHLKRAAVFYKFESKLLLDSDVL